MSADEEIRPNHAAPLGRPGEVSARSFLSGRERISHNLSPWSQIELAAKVQNILINILITFDSTCLYKYLTTAAEAIKDFSFSLSLRVYLHPV